MFNLNVHKLREWVWPWPWTFKLFHREFWSNQSATTHWSSSIYC